VQSSDRPLVVSATGEPLKTFGLASGVTLLCRGAVDAQGAPVSLSDLDRRLRSGQDLERLGAPSAALLIDGDQAVIAADHVGFRHIFGVKQPGWAAAGTSARDLATRIGAKLNLEALSVQRMVGHHLNEDTPYMGVRKLPAAHFWKLADGDLHATPYPALRKVPFTRDLIAVHAARLRELVCGFLDQHDDVVLELSGGMDSRLILAAVPADRRKEITGFTLVHGGSADGPVARKIAERYGMRHVEANLEEIAGFDPRIAYELAYAAALRQDGMGAPLSAAVFEWAERDVASGARLSGHGGEFARVGFSLLQPNRPKQTPQLADRFFNMWFANNYGVPDSSLTDEFAAASREIGYRRVRETFASYEGDWMSAIDQFFLKERLHRWAGATITATVNNRVTLNPLLDREVLTIMLSLPHRRRWSSQQAVDVMSHLDKELAEMPLGSGMRPVVLRRPSAVTRMIGETPLHKFAGRAGRKVLRHRRGLRRYAAGAPVLAELVVQHWRENPSLVEPAANSGLINVGWLDRLLSGVTDTEAASVDFILNLTVLLGSL
jgi:asparagine synthase (glutamine-hydrolysing)